ncbi:hypothetical protein Sjap_016256 [Stephania japonica]|uniref:CRM domain-containing protein n=1 Tax=Stephania japonica TaxID=461633 RepID=A0AAP0NTB6_9MAGN
MWASGRTLQRHCFNTLSSRLLLHHNKVVENCGNSCSKSVARNVFDEMLLRNENLLGSKKMGLSGFFGSRAMSTARGRSMRSKVERLMRRDVGKTQKEIRRARNLRKKLMTDEERMIWSLRRAKKKVALLLQKLKKYELPELPPPRHDPELLTSEQLQAYKKIGFRNKNYVPVGVRGVFGGVVQNMHLHWKFHETVQVCCDNFPKEKIKEMATMLARLSGGIVVNVHDVKTIIMFRGRNYRQPKNLIPINTLTKRKALFKARFEQALESQKLNIKKIEQQLRRKGVNPDDPVAMASIQRVASTFFSAIDEKQGTPYVFHENMNKLADPDVRDDEDRISDEREREQLEKFIADIEEAAEQEWEAEEAAEQEELGRIRYRNREDFGGRTRRSHMSGAEDSEDEIRGRRGREWTDKSSKRRATSQHNWDGNDDEEDEAEGSEDDESKANNFDSDSDIEHEEVEVPRKVNEKQNAASYTKNNETFKAASYTKNNETFKRNGGSILQGKVSDEDSESDIIFSESDNSLWDSEDEKGNNSMTSKRDDYEFVSSDSEDENISEKRNQTKVITNRSSKTSKQVDEEWDSD